MSASSLASPELMSATVLALGEFLSGFPAEEVPDGAIFAPHHFLYGVYLALLAAGTVWDDLPKKEPLLVVGSLGVGWFGFTQTWRYHPELGAAMSLLGCIAALAALAQPRWNDWPQRTRATVAFFTLVALDDAVSHGFGVWTPLDAGWKASPLVVKLAAFVFLAGGVGFLIANAIIRFRSGGSGEGSE